ncbi:hypothetical protein DL93DRAFT_2231554 [Clavulina sp. PMI_390]|nr:hypothetical protein DL93DRAFT_2231554 [Clavulina sp. PMI_390]
MSAKQLSRQSELLASELENLTVVDDAVSARRLANWEAPAVSLLPELLGDIFLRCIYDDKYQGPEHILARISSYRQMIVSVCHRWRQVARGTQALWAVTKFSPSRFASLNPGRNDFSQRVLQSSERVSHDLELAGTAPMTLVSWLPYDSAMSPEHIARLEYCFESTVVPIFPRCKRIVLGSEDESPLKLLDFSSKQLTKLESLDVRTSSFRRRTDIPSQTLDLSHACNIRDLTIRISESWGLASAVAIISPKLADATKLQTLTLTGLVDFKAAFEIVSQACSLRSLVWSPACHLPPLQILHEEIHLPYLRLLKLGFAALSILPLLNAPNVLTFTVSDATPNGPTSLPEQAQFPHLRALALMESSGSLNEQLLPAFLHKHPTLEWFALENTFSTSLASACVTAQKLRAVEAHGDPMEMDGTRLLLGHWAGRVASGNMVSSLYEMKLINDSRNGPCYYVPEDDDDYPVKLFACHPGILVHEIHRPYFPWHWPKDWDELFHREDPSYQTCFE